ncbi:Tetratricopeptide repeat (TPR)-like superfamily protein [Forsythia ovata]|uniref:Tetratricopeptide repeat (TPR)-like superfamily protein n=1 Tax=Forsythia ovata TaxID=205694 RepID=A0ABD1WFG8_9LAMI
MVCRVERWEWRGYCGRQNISRVAEGYIQRLLKMFSISAINDTDSKNQWQPLTPTKEAQEFHLSQMYHDGLLKLQAKDYEKARELLEAVLKDPLVSNAQAENSATDCHLLQLRFLALKNLATVFLQECPTYHESALRCYLQAVEIDNNDSVVWNQLGTLSCSMGSLSISRWAFEQGLVCSPNNWNCMEKLLEVLIAIGDEMACLSVANLILRHWPSHSRALHVKNTIEESEPIPFAPRGIDKLEPKHIRLKFGEKRKAPNEGIDKAKESKRLKQSIELQLPEASWIALASELLEILCPTVASSEPRTEGYRSWHVRISIQLNFSSGNVMSSVERKEPICMTAGASMSVSNCNSGNDGINIYKEEAIFEEQPQERRSSRLRSRKPGKEESDFATNKDFVKVVKQFLEPYLVGNAEPKECNHDAPFSVYCAEGVASSLDTQHTDVIKFVQKTSENFGAYHMSHLLLEEIANRGISCQDSNSKILDLEKLTRHRGLERTPECSLFLGELYYDFGIHSLDTAAMREFMSEVSYHLCKIIESVALEYPFHMNGMQGKENCSSDDSSEQNHQLPIDSTSLLRNNYPFWVRFSWLSAHLSLLEGDKAKARQQFSVALSLLVGKEKMNYSLGSICLPHCKAIKKITADRVLHEMNLIEVDYLKKTVSEMLEKHMYSECVNLLAPLLLSANDVRDDVLHAFNQEGKGFNSVELSALDALIKACEQEKSMDISVYLNCHRRKLQILVAGADLEGIPPNKTPVSNASSTESTESLSKQWNHLVAEEVKAISQSASRIKSIISPGENSNGVPMTVVGDIQSLLLALMCNIAGTYFSKKSSGLGVPHSIEQTERCSFVDAAIAFCKLQHLDFSVPIKTQTELIGAIHDMLAEFGICCAHGIGEEEGTFLKFAIKHLLALDMKLKSNFQSLRKGQEIKSAQHCSPENHLKKSEQLSDGIHINESPNKSHFNMLTTEVAQTDAKDEASATGKDVGRLSSEGLSSHRVVDSERIKAEIDNNVGDGLGVLFQEREIQNSQIVDSGNEPMEDEEEELELGIDSVLDQCFYCLYGLNLRSDSSYEEDLAMHKNTSRGDYQTKEQCADVFQYILPYAKASSKTGLVKLRRVLRAIRKHFPQPPDNILAGNAIVKFLDDPDLCEDNLLKEAGSDVCLDSIMKIIFSEPESVKQNKASSIERSEPYLEVYSNLFYLLAQSEEMSATDKWAGFVLTKEGEEFVEQNANLFKYDLLYNPLRFESWQRLANIYDEEVDLLLNDGSKQINVLGWRKNATLAERVEASRRRSRRCLLMTLALATTAIQQGEIHELLALVYYDGIQNVVPFYDQRYSVPLKDAAWKIFCQNSMRHFKKAFKHKEEWSHAFYLGKLSEKLGYSHDISFSYYAKAIALNPSAVDPFYRMHASRMKLLCACGKQNEEALKVVATYSFAHSTKESVMNILSRLGPESSESSMLDEDRISNNNSEPVDFHKFEKAWHLLYSDCLSALETCVEGDLKHFHKARYMLAQGLYKRGRTGDLDKAKEELSFCFKSSRSSFTINMWEIDSMVKKGRRKTPGPSGNRKTLEVNLAESSRKFITCIRKYMLFYLKLLEETGEISTLDRAYISLRADKRFSLCLEDLVPVALGRYIRALIFSIRQSETDLDSANHVEHLLEKLFSLLLEQVNLWPDICCLPELSSPELTESNLFGYLYQYIQWLERNVKVETLEGINEKIRKRLKNPKLSNSNCAKVYRHVSAAWCRSLVISMALITPLHSRLSSDIQVQNLLGGGFENEQLLCVDLQSEELWNSAFEDLNHLKILESKWNPSLSRIKNVIVKRVSDEDLETASSLLRSSYNFYKDTSCALLPSGINLYMVPPQLATETYIQPGIDGGVDLLDMNTSRKLLLWAYTLLHGHCTNVSHAIKYCEENVKSKMKRGTGSSCTPLNANVAATSASHPGGGKDGTGKTSESEFPKSPAVVIASLSESAGHKVASSTSPETENKLNLAFASLPESESKDHVPSVPVLETGSVACSVSSGHLPLLGSTNWANGASSDEKEKAFSATPCLLHCNNPVAEMSSADLQNDTDPEKV